MYVCYIYLVSLFKKQSLFGNQIPKSGIKIRNGKITDIIKQHNKNIFNNQLKFDTAM